MPHPPIPVPDRLRRAWRTGLLACERALFAAGALALGLYGLACANAAVAQQTARASFEHALAEQLYAEQHDQTDWDATRKLRFHEARNEPVTPLGRLEIPDAKVSVMILDGTEDWTLNRAVGRIRGTARVGEVGNLGIAGHRDGIFRGLRHLEIGDAIALATLEGTGHYVVESLRIVAPSDVEVLAPTPEPTITLVTCYPFYFVGDAPQRFVVHARQAAFEPWSETRLPDVAAH